MTGSAPLLDWRSSAHWASTPRPCRYCGADGLKPDEHQLTWRAGTQPIARVHFAFHDGMSDEARDYLVQAVGEALGGVMDTAAQGAKPTD